MSQAFALLPAATVAHLRLTLIALTLGVALGVPLGILVRRSRAIGAALLGIASVIQTIPTLALLAVMVPMLAALALPSIGFLPALIGLTLYSLLPILRNTVTGIEGVDADLTEAARGVGMTPAQQLRLVELPLALPVIVAGVRTATVWTVGAATLATPVGANSLGDLIFGGLQTRNSALVLVGSAAAALLALLLDGLVHALEVGVRERRRPLIVLALAGLLALAGVAAASWLGPRAGGVGAPVRIGAKTFTEQYILADILSQWVRERTGAPTEIKASLGSTVALDALRAGDIDTYVDYSGTLWTTVLKRTGPPASRAEAIAEIERFLAEHDGIEVLGSLGFENAYALAMRGADADRRGIRTISQLVPVAPTLRVGGDYELFTRPEWKSLETTYGLRFAEQRTMDPALLYSAIESKAVDVIGAYSTDGRIAALDLRVLEDDRHAIPPYDAVLLARRGLASERPDVVAALRALAGKISNERMRELNLAVDEKGETPAQVARDFLAADLSTSARTGP